MKTNKEIKRTARNKMVGHYWSLTWINFLPVLLLVVAYLVINHFLGRFYATGPIQHFFGQQPYLGFYLRLMLGISLFYLFLVLFLLTRIRTTFALTDFIRGKGLTWSYLWGKKGPKIGKDLARYHLELFVWSFIPFGGIYHYYNLAQSFLILQDHPNEGQPLRTSEQLMLGHKWQLFFLDLSFIPWYLLGFFSFGLLNTWVLPYHRLSRILFYQELGFDQVLV